jgi:hypothetical protein
MAKNLEKVLRYATHFGFSPGNNANPDPVHHLYADPDSPYHFIRILILPFNLMRIHIHNTGILFSLQIFKTSRLDFFMCAIIMLQIDIYKGNSSCSRKQILPILKRALVSR